MKVNDVPGGLMKLERVAVLVHLIEHARERLALDTMRRVNESARLMLGD
jgi:hypothetical protein